MVINTCTALHAVNTADARTHRGRPVNAVSARWANSCGRPAGPNTPLTPCAARKPTAALIANSNRSPGSLSAERSTSSTVGTVHPATTPDINACSANATSRSNG